MISNQVQKINLNKFQSLPVEIWHKKVDELARYLLGKRLLRVLHDELIVTRIVETEAYHQSEPSCHAFRGKTARNSPLFHPPGFSYVYFTYGMYHCLNVTAEPANTGAAVLIRALEPISPLWYSRAFSGPGLLCKRLNLNRFEHNLVDLKKPNHYLWLCEGEDISSKEVISSSRIGIKKALDLMWRFRIKGNTSVSK